MLVQPGADERAAPLRRAAGRDQPPARAARLEQPERLEARERLAEHRARDAELLDQLALGREPVARRELALQDPRADRLGRGLDERARSCARRAPSRGRAEARELTGRTRRRGRRPAPETTCSLTSATLSSKRSAISVTSAAVRTSGGASVALWGEARTSRPRRRAACWTAVPTGCAASERPARGRVDEVEAVEEAAAAQVARDRVARRRSRAAAPRARRRARRRSRARRAPRSSGSRRGRTRRRRGWPRTCARPGTGRRRRRSPQNARPTFSVRRTAESGA